MTAPIERLDVNARADKLSDEGHDAILDAIADDPALELALAPAELDEAKEAA